jgi:hypothetical protein
MAFCVPYSNQPFLMLAPKDISLFSTATLQVFEHAGKFWIVAIIKNYKAGINWYVFAAHMQLP